MLTMRVLCGRRPGITIASGLIGTILLILGGCSKNESVDTLVKEATALREAGNFPAAVIKLESALTKDPKNIGARLLSAQLDIDLAQGNAALGILARAKQDGAAQLDVAKPWAEAELITHRYDDVVRDTADLPENAPNSAKASLLAYRGSALAVLGQRSNAQVALAQGLALDEHSIDVRVALARLAIASDDLDAARKQLADATHESPKDRGLSQLRGDIAYAARDYPEAEEIYQKILDKEPWNALARSDLAASQLADGKLTEAADSLDTILNDPDLANIPQDPMLSHVRSVVAYQQKDYLLAQTDSENVVSRAPSYEPARLIAGASSYALGEYERANYYMGPYVYQEPGDLLARKLLAKIQLRLNHSGEAAKTLAPLKNVATEDLDLLTLIGVSAARSGDLPTAAQYLKLAVEQQPDNLLLRTELGRTEVALGNPKAGIEDFEHAVRTHPEALEPQVPLFLAYMQTKQYDKALALAEQVIKIEPNDPTGYLFASSVYLVQGNEEAGRAALLKARDVHPGDINANRNLAKLALAQGKVDEARREYQDTLKDNPQNTPTYIALADLEVRANDPQEAEAVLLRGVQANPDDVTVNAVLARFQLAEGKTQDALTRGQQTLQKSPRTPALLDLVGRAQLALGQSDAALSTFRDLVDIAPRDAWAHIDLAEAYLARYTPNTPQWPAINEATEAVTLAPHDNAAKLVLARALIMHGRFGEAREVIKELRTDQTQNIAVLELDGLLARGEGRLADATAAFAQAVALKDNAIDRKRLAETQLQIGQTDDAAKTLATWVDAHPEDIETRKMLADLYVGAGRLTEANEQFAELVRQRPKDAAVQNNLAWVLSRLGHLEEALAHAREAVALAPDSVDALDTLGTILLQTGVPAAALDPLDNAWQKSSHKADIGFHLSQALVASGRKQEALELLRGLLAAGGEFQDRAQAQQLLQQLGG